MVGRKNRRKSRRDEDLEVGGAPARLARHASDVPSRPVSVAKKCVLNSGECPLATAM